MRSLIVVIGMLFLVGDSAWAICSLPPPPDRGGRGTPPTPTPGPSPTPTPTPGPGGGIPTPGGSGPRARTRGPSFAPSWRLWWELNREYLFGLRKTHLAGRAVTESATDSNPLDEIRLEVRKGLRAVAFDEGEKDSLRSTALRALGRAGRDEDVVDFLRLLRGSSDPAIREGAAIGLASVHQIENESTREAVRAYFCEFLEAGGREKTDRAALVTLLACGLCARHDERLALELRNKLERPVESSGEAVALLFACGLTRNELLSQTLASIARTGRLGKRKLGDLARAHCVLGLAMCGGGSTAPTLAKLLTAKKVQVLTRRSTALAIGLLLREGTVDGVSDKDLQKALLYCFEKEHDQLVKGYCAIAMGAARKPFLLNVLVKLIDKTGSATVKPYAALALGLAARTLGGRDAAMIQKLLRERLPEARDLELVGALTIALGLARATDALDMLEARATMAKLPGVVRGPACQSLGLLGNATPKVRKTLGQALDDVDYIVIEDAALALGFLGGSGTGHLLTGKLVETKVPSVQIHLVVALSHLGGTEPIDRLLAVLGDRQKGRRLRGSAASVLGILLDPRERDPLFEIDAYASPYGLSEATRELVRIY